MVGMCIPNDHHEIQMLDEDGIDQYRIVVNGNEGF